MQPIGEPEQLEALVARATTLAGAWGGTAAAARRPPGRSARSCGCSASPGIDRAGRPLAAEVVDRWVAPDPRRLGGGIALPFAMAHGRVRPGAVRARAQEVAAGNVDLGLEAELLARVRPPGGRRRRTPARSSRAALDRIDANRTARRELLAAARRPAAAVARRRARRAGDRGRARRGAGRDRRRRASSSGSTSRRAASCPTGWPGSARRVKAWRASDVVARRPGRVRPVRLADPDRRPARARPSCAGSSTRRARGVAGTSASRPTPRRSPRRTRRSSPRSSGSTSSIADPMREIVVGSRGPGPRARRPRVRAPAARPRRDPASSCPAGRCSSPGPRDRRAVRPGDARRPRARPPAPRGRPSRAATGCRPTRSSSGAIPDWLVDEPDFAGPRRGRDRPAPGAPAGAPARVHRAAPRRRRVRPRGRRSSSALLPDAGDAETVVRRSHDNARRRRAGWPRSRRACARRASRPSSPGPRPPTPRGAVAAARDARGDRGARLGRARRPARWASGPPRRGQPSPSGPRRSTRSRSRSSARA